MRLAVPMRLNDIVRRGRQFIESDQGRAIGRKVADGASGVARKVAPSQASTIDKAQRAAHDYLDRPGASGGPRAGSGRGDTQGVGDEHGTPGRPGSTDDGRPGPAGTP